ncbi:MAG TPA: helicase-associated domain-containing protein [Gemmataceae bacterium]|nr:helicase-associated domain-containing protein [Gemmataceae bacterium]
MFWEWWKRQHSPQKVRKPSSEPRTRPALEPCPPPAEPGPESGTDIPDIRAMLLELVADRARLRRNHNLFQKETERFESALAPLPDWLVQMYNLTPPRRRDIALYWAKRLQLTRELREGKRQWLDLTEAGRSWLTRPIEEQYALIYQRLREPDRADGSYSSWGHEFDDGWFLGSVVSSVPVSSGRKSREDWGTALTAEQRQPLREGLYAAFAELPIGVFHRFDTFAAYVCFGPHNPLLLGQRLDKVRVRVAGRILLPRDEPLYDTGRRLLGQLVSNRLVSLGCLQAGRDADGELLIARLPRLDVYFGRTAPPEAGGTGVAPVVVVQPDFSVLVIGVDQSPLAELMPFCERLRERSSPGAATLRLTRASVVKGAVMGLSSAQMLERLQSHCSKPLPGNVVHEVREWADWVRVVSAAPAVLFRCPDVVAADRIVVALGRHAEKINDTTVALASADLGDADRRKLLEQGIIISHGEDTPDGKKH